MENYDVCQITDLAAYAGKLLLASGADIVRVEDTVRHIMTSYGMREFEIFTLTNGIFLHCSGTERIISPDGVTSERPRDKLRIHNVHLYSTDLGRVDKINTLSRNIERGGITPEAAMEQLKKIESTPQHSPLLRMLAAALASGTICYMFGGTLTDSLTSFAVGFLYYILAVCLDETKLSRLLTNIICAATITLLTHAACRLGVPANAEMVIIGSIMPLVPGVSFTNAVRDLASGDYISGIVRMTDALIVAVGIAVGVGGTLGLLELLHIL